MEFGKITDEAMEKVKALIGKERTKSSMHPLADMLMTSDFNRRFCTGVADMNPVYLDEEYAKKSRYGGLIAHPGALCMMERANGATDGFPGCHAIWRGVEYEWFKPVMVGDTITSKTYLENVEEVESKFAGGRAAVQTHKTVGTNQNGEDFGTIRAFWHRFDRRGAAGTKKEKEQRGLAQYTPSDLEKIKEEYKQVSKRGAEPLYWEDVNVGDPIPFLIKGPTTIISRLAFEMMGGGGGWFVGHHLAFELFDKHPGLPFINEQGVPEAPVSIHWSHERCQKYLGLPGAYDAGYERNIWLVEWLTNWIGDHGALKNLKLRYTGFTILGDTTRCTGSVTGKRVEDGQHIVECEIKTQINVDDIVTTTGTAEVILPSKG